jgi:D-glycero-D-manno-heptose 1,7-bisphosphate phosphatase
VSPLPVFLDRDGVINRDSPDYIRSLDQWVPIPGSLQAMADLSAAGHPLVVVTNQSAVSRGYTTLQDVEAINDALLRSASEAGARVSGVYFCPHHPDDMCGCRKPETGMIDSARRDLDLPPGGWMVGDAATDMELGRRAGLRTILVLTGRGEEQLGIIRGKGDPMPGSVVPDLRSAADIILEADQA